MCASLIEINFTPIFFWQIPREKKNLIYKEIIDHTIDSLSVHLPSPTIETCLRANKAFNYFAAFVVAK